jgi:glutathione S-transferase
LAPILTEPALYRYFGLEIDRSTMPNVEAWHKRLMERPAYQEHVMIPFDDLKDKLSY